MASTKQPDAGQLLAEQLVHRLDPARWMSEAVQIDLDHWQCSVVRDPHKRVGVTAPRQSGKSFTIGCKLAHVALFKRDPMGGPTTSIIVSPSERQSRLLAARTAEICDRAGVKIAQRSEGRLVFANGAQIIAVPAGQDAGATIRGYSVSGVLVIDEAAFALDDDGELMSVVMPMVSVAKGQMVLISSAGFEGSPFHKIMEQGQGDWSRYRIAIEECPRLDQEVLDDLLGQLGPALFAREMLLKWDVSGFSPVNLAAARAAADDGALLDPEPLMNGAAADPKVVRDREILLSVDPAQMTDWSAFTLMRLEDIVNGTAKVRLLGAARHQKVSYDIQTKQIVRVVKSILDAGARSCQVSIDAGGVGRGLLDAVRDADPVTANAGGTSTHGGQKSHLDRTYNIIRVAKLSLISFIDGAFATKHLVYNRDALGADILISEIMNLRANTTAGGNTTIEAGKGHDDVFFSVCQGLYFISSGEVGTPIWSAANVSYFERLSEARAPAEVDYQSEVMPLSDPVDSLVPPRRAPYRFRIQY